MEQLSPLLSSRKKDGGPSEEAGRRAKGLTVGGRALVHWPLTLQAGVAGHQMLALLLLVALLLLLALLLCFCGAVPSEKTGVSETLRETL